MVENIIKRIEEEIKKSYISNLEGNYKYITRKTYIKNTYDKISYKEYDEIKFTISIFTESKYSYIEKELHSIKIVINTHDYILKSYNPCSNILLKQYSLKEISKLMNDSYLYLTKNNIYKKVI